jgi:hypothetical protein
MLTEQELESAKKSNDDYKIICGIVDSLPEEQWLDAITKALPNASRFSIMQNIMIHKGGDIIIDGKQCLG